MATISNKNINTLVDNFLRNPKKFQSYIKHCLNILENYNILKEEQYNTLINDYNYFMKIFNYFRLDSGSFLALNEMYRKYCLENLNQGIVNVKTNIFYLDDISIFLNHTLEDLNNIEDMLDSNTIKEDKIICNRMICSLYLLEDTKLKDNVYTFDELISMVNNNLIIIIDNHVEKELLTSLEIEEGLKENNLVLNNASLNYMGIDAKIASDYANIKNDSDRQAWYILNSNFCRYIRYNLGFDECDNNSIIHLYHDFNDVVNHIKSIIKKVTRYYNQRRKKIPDSVNDVINYALDKLEEETARFQNKQETVNQKIKKFNN